MVAWVLLLSAVETAAPAVVVDVPANAPCALERELPAALAEEHVAVAPSRWRLEARVGPQTLDVSLFDEQNVLRGARTFQPSDDDCPLIPKAIATLVRTWLESAFEVAGAPEQTAPAAHAAPIPARARPPRTLVAQEPRPPPEPSPPPVEVEEDATSTPPIPSRASRPHVVVSQPSAEPEEPAAPVPDAPQLEDEDLEVQAERERVEPQPAAEEHDHALSVHASGGGAIAPGDSAVLYAAFGGDWAFSVPFALQLEGGIESARVGEKAFVTISSSLSWVGLAIRCRFFTAGLSGLFFSVGGRFERMAVFAEGAVTDSREVLTGAGVVALEWRQAIKAGFFVSVKTVAQLRPRSENFSVPQKADVLVVPPWGFGASVGLGWSFF